MSYKYIDEKKEHLHTLDERPLIGTSTAMNVVAKNLVWWAAELAAVEALMTGEHIPTIRDEYNAACASDDKKKAIDVLQKKYPAFKAARFAHFNVKNQKAEAGTDLHAELEKFIKFKMTGEVADNTMFDAKIMPFIKWAELNVKRYLWSEGHCYSREMWTGGISDVGVELMNGEIAIIDFKSAKEAFATHFFQIAGYDLEIAENGWFDEEGNLLGTLEKPITRHIVVPFGARVVEPVVSENVLAHREAFKHAIGLYKVMQSLGAI
jgi:hypothetical protein